MRFFFPKKNAKLRGPYVWSLLGKSVLELPSFPSYNGHLQKGNHWQIVMGMKPTVCVGSAETHTWQRTFLSDFIDLKRHFPLLCPFMVSSPFTAKTKFKVACMHVVNYRTTISNFIVLYTVTKKNIYIYRDLEKSQWKKKCFP